jgi:hypothetical protein
MNTANVFKPASIKRLFKFCRTPALASRASERIARMVDRLPNTGRNYVAKDAGYALSRALNEQRHMLREVRDFGPASPMAMEHANARDRNLRILGL